MQSAEASRCLADLDRGLIASRLRSLLALNERGDIAGLKQYLAEDVIYVGSAWKPYPLTIRREGREACLDLLKAYYIAYEALNSTIHELVIDGEWVAVARTTTLRNRGSGRFADIHICNFLRFREGLIAEYSEYPDTAAIAALDDD